MVLSTMMSAHERRSGRGAATAPSRGGPAMRRGHRRASAGGAAGVFAGQGRSRPGPRRGLRRALAPFHCLPALALLLGVLSPFAAAPAAAAVLVSNIGSGGDLTSSNLLGSDPTRAQGFTTGSNAAGYTLTSVEINFRNRSALTAQQIAALKMEVWTSTTAGLPDAKHATLMNPSSFPAGTGSDNQVTVAFAAPTGTTLAANTTYHVVMYGANGRIAAFHRDNGNEDTGGAAGWSIADKYLFKTMTGWSQPGFTETLRIRVNGEAAQASDTVTLSVSPTTLVAGQIGTATVTLSAAQTGWVLVDIGRSGGTAHDARVQDPQSVYLAAGATSGTARVITNATVTQALGTKNITLGTITKQSNVGTITKGSPSSVQITVISASDQNVRNAQAEAGDGALRVTWDAPSQATPTAYEVHYTSSTTVGNNAAVQSGTAANGWVAVSRTGTAREQAISSLDNGTAYRVRIRPAFGNTAASPPWRFASGTPAVPITATLSVSPTFLVAGQSATATVTLSAAQPGWVQVGVDRSGGTAHQARVLDPPSVYLTAGDTSGTSTVRTNATVPQALGTKNIVIGTITKQPNVGTIVAGSPSSVEIEVVEPRSVRNLDATAASGRLDLSWDAPLEVTATGYHVHYTSAPKTGSGAVTDNAAVQTGTAADGWVAVSRTGTTTTSQAISSLTNGTDYRVRVRAVYVSDGSIRSAWEHTSGTPEDTTPTVTLSASPTNGGEGRFVHADGDAVGRAARMGTSRFWLLHLGRRMRVGTGQQLTWPYSPVRPASRPPSVRMSQARSHPGRSR